MFAHFVNSKTIKASQESKHDSIKRFMSLNQLFPLLFSKQKNYPYFIEHSIESWFFISFFLRIVFWESPSSMILICESLKMRAISLNSSKYPFWPIMLNQNSHDCKNFNTLSYLLINAPPAEIIGAITFVRFTQQRVERFAGTVAGGRVAGHGKCCHVRELLAGILCLSRLVQYFRILEIFRQSAPQQTNKYK